MNVFSERDLAFHDYSWTVFPPGDPRVSGKPDSTLFNRKEGYEMLYLINAICKEYDLDKNGATKIERMIRNQVPAQVKSQVKVKEWVIANWSVGR